MWHNSISYIDELLSQYNKAGIKKRKSLDIECYEVKDLDLSDITQSIKNREDEIRYIEACKEVKPEILSGFYCNL